MIRITELSLPLDHSADELRQAIVKRLNISDADLLNFSVFKRSYDARKKNSVILFIYILDVEVRDEAAVLARFADDNHVRPAPDTRYYPVGQAPADLTERPLVVGFARAGCSPRCCSHRWASSPSCWSAAGGCAAAPRTPGRCGARRP